MEREERERERERKGKGALEGKNRKMTTGAAS